MGLFNSRSAAASSCWLLMGLALQLLLVQAIPSRYALRGYRGRRIGQPRSKVEAPLPRLPFPVPITLLGGGAQLMFPPPPKEFAHANFLPTSAPVDDTSGVIKITFSKDKVETSLAVEDNTLNQEKTNTDFQTITPAATTTTTSTTVTATTTTIHSKQKSHFVVVPDAILPLETRPPSAIPKSLTSNIGQLQDDDVLSNSIIELTTPTLNEEILTVTEKEIVLTSELPNKSVIKILTSNVLDISPNNSFAVESEAHSISDIQAIATTISDPSSNVNSTVNSKTISDLADINKVDPTDLADKVKTDSADFTEIVKSDPVDSNALEILPLFFESHDSVDQELLRLSSNESESESENNSIEIFGETEEVKDSQSFKVADTLPGITLQPLLSSQSSFEDDNLASTSEYVDVPVTDTIVEKVNEINEQGYFVTEPSNSLIDLTTIDPQPFKRSHHSNKYQPIWVIHDFGSANKASSKQSLSSVSHRTWRNPTWQ